MSSDACLRSARPLFAAVCCATSWLVIIGQPATLSACDTPVYRYAMYRWEPTSYEVYHFHQGEVDAAFTAVREEISKAHSDPIAPANVAVYPVNLDEDPELKTVPRDVRRLWEAKTNEGAKPPLTVIVNPLGYEVYSGELESKDVPALIKSPARTQIGKLLQQGHAGVYLLVPGKDDALNKAAEEAVQKLVEDVNAGKLQLYAGPNPYNPLDPKFELPEEPSNGGDEGNEAKDDQEESTDAPSDASIKEETKSPHSIAMLKLDREQIGANDPWLYRSLMAAERDLHDFQDEPMLFVVYGRGRALPPYIGKGIVYNNLVEITDFITSACSCTVKDQNPGVDLLMAYDWESAAADLAEKFGSEEGNNESLTDLFPQLIVPGGGAKTEQPANNTVDESGDSATNIAASEDVAPDGDGQSATADDDPESKMPSDDTAASSGESADEAAGGSKSAHDALPVVASTRTIDDPDVEVVVGPNFMVTLGIGMGVAFLALLAATFLILKPQ